MLRKRFLSDLDEIARGADPKAVIRDPAINQCVPLPIAERKILSQGATREELLKHPLIGKTLTEGFPFQAGQPEEVRRAYEEAMGIRLNVKK